MDRTETILQEKYATAYAENIILERIVNTFLQSEDVPKHLIEFTLKCCGTDLFYQCFDDTYIGRGIDRGIGR